VWHAITLPFSCLSHPLIASEVSAAKHKLLELTTDARSEAEVERTLNELMEEMKKSPATMSVGVAIELIASRRDRYFAPFFANIPHFGQRATSRVEAENFLTKHHQLTRGKVQAGKLCRET
jgi:hypothetical protein